MIRFRARMFPALAAAIALVGVTAYGSASGQVVSDELQIILPGGATMTYTAYDPTSGFESILAFGNVTGGTQTTDDDSATLSTSFVSGTGASATFNTSGATTWFTHQKATTQFVETALTEPSSTAISDIMFSFMATMNGTSVNAVALISDPTLVADILKLNAPSATVAETGALQNVTSLVFPAANYPSGAPFTVNVLSAVPEPGSWMLLLGGLGAAALLYRRRQS